MPSRRFVRLFLVLALFALAAQSQDFLTIIPSNPVSADDIRVEMGGVWRDSCVPGSSTVTVSGSTIRVRLEVQGGGACLTVLTGWRANVSLPRLATGDYQLIVEIMDVNGLRVFGTRSFTVSEPILHLSPASGPVTGGREVTISGPGIAECALIITCPGPTVTFGNVTLTSNIRVVDQNTIVVVAPPASRGWVGVTVRDPDGKLHISSGFYYFDPAVERDPGAFTRVLFPVFFLGPGALGSQWITDIWIHNGSTDPVTAYRDLIFTFCPPADPCNRPIPARSSAQLSERNGTRIAGLLFYPGKSAEDELSYSIHIRDLSRSLQTWGTEIPVVREEDFRSGTIALLNVPAEPRFRQTLRLYDPDSRDGAEVMLRLYSITGTFPFHQSVVTLRTSLRCILPCGPNVDEPAYAQVDLAPLMQGVTPVRVELVPLTSGLRFWGFVTATNNETQHVTTITPQ